MDGLSLLLSIVGLLAIIAIVGLAPFLLPWPQHARWLAITQMLDPFAPPKPEWQLREVTITAMTCCRDDVEIDVVEGPDHHNTLTITGTTLSAAAVGSLHAWCAAGTPLLMLLRSDRRVCLYGPTESVVELHRRSATMAQISSTTPNGHAPDQKPYPLDKTQPSAKAATN